MVNLRQRSTSCIDHYSIAESDRKRRLLSSKPTVARATVTSAMSGKINQLQMQRNPETLETENSNNSAET
ncbi:MAG: hypothetical protein MHPSP_004478, partial [Paramarteilia canceri]